ncbi:MAG: threonine synthase [Phycisphaerae bacterium]|nr:threonine synthase [Phycisphaerae bacterium]
MDQQTRYYSTNHKVPEVKLREALLQGQAGDLGLFMPKHLPHWTTEELADLADRPYAEIAHLALRRFTGGMLGDSECRALCNDAYDFDVPLEHVTRKTYVMRLDRGPTASFKDFAARMMARWLGRLVRDRGGELVILTATSGDTGSAVAHAFHGVEGIRVVVLFPVKEVSDRQRKQMTTIGGNVTTTAVEGKFDDCQAMVKRAFADPSLTSIRLTSANSINIGRLLPQSVYYIYAYTRLADIAAGEPIIFCVPSGNFGDMMGGLLAGRMGLPVRRFVIATNANDEVPRFLATGRYEKIVPSRVCISNAMNVGHPSNLARLVDLYGGRMDEQGTLHQPPDFNAMGCDLYAVGINDDETRRTIKEAYAQFNLLLEPHGAVGWAGLTRFFTEHPEDADVLTVSLETAHPAKFPDEIRACVGVDPDPPPSLVGLDQRKECYTTIPADYDAFHEMLVGEFKR